MREKLFQTSADLITTNLIRVSEQLNLDVAAFRACLENEQMVSQIKQDRLDAAAAGFTGAPSFVLGRCVADKITGVVIEGAKPYAVFDAEVKRLLGASALTQRVGQ